MMRHALMLARRNLGQTWPNPAVGAVIVKDGQVVGRGWTQKGGRPHAETQAIRQAGDRARGATMFVTLEPCPHQGKTPPCTEAIIQTGIAKVVVACRDPHPQVNGKGIAALRAAKIEVSEGECEKEARSLNEGFFSVVERGRPFVSMKLATSLDGCAAYPPDSEQRWITGEAARRFGHRLRAEHDAVLTGIGTVLTDNPMLTVRISGLEARSPVRVVIDRNGRLPVDSALLKSADKVPLWILRPDESKKGEQLPRALKALAERGITRLLVEAGPTLSTAFLEAGLVDRLYWFHAPVIIGDRGYGLPALVKLPPVFRPVDSRAIGDDRLETYEAA